MSSTFYLGFKLWRNGSLYINPDVAGGSGLGGTLGVAGYMNGEIFRVGTPAPTFYFSRAFIRHYIPLTGDVHYVAPSANQLGEWVPDNRIQITFGKITLTDMFDCNSYSHDPRTRLLNWSLMNAGAYDFASNTKGFTYAAVVEYITPKCSARFGVAIEPQYANGPLTDKRFVNGISLMDMEINLKTKNYGFNVEVEKPFNSGNKKPSIIRILGFVNRVTAGKYTEAMVSPLYKTDTNFIQNASHALQSVRKVNAIKYGFSINLEQPLGKHGGLFSRLSWNDGQTESFAFAEIDRSESVGIIIHGTAWDRIHDKLQMAVVFNQISSQHASYLVNGGYGFMLGEPHMRYAGESIMEIQYVCDIGKDFEVSPDLQYIINPGYDSNRGNIFVLGVRLHINF